MRLFDDVASRVDDPYLRRAVALAERARGQTAPNPLVGCVVVSDDRIVGEGFHQRAGEPHAEVIALSDAGDQVAGSDVYVTLEPCAHHGRTPPCADALIAAGVRRVVIGMPDPSPQASGGAARLREAGIAVEFADDPTPFADLIAGWLNRLHTGLPLVVAKAALSLDGHGAFSFGKRATITGTSGAEVTAMLRGRADAVLVGAATVIADNPSLTVRSPDGSTAEYQPLRVVLVGQHVPSVGSRVFSDSAAPTLVVAGDRAPEELLLGLSGSVDVQRFSASEGLVGALRALGDRGIGEVLVEPGTRLLTALWEQQLIDAFVTVVAGGMAGAGSPPAYAGARDSDSGDLMHLMTPVEAGIVGDVAVTVWCPSRDTATP